MDPEDKVIKGWHFLYILSVFILRCKVITCPFILTFCMLGDLMSSDFFLSKFTLNSKIFFQEYYQSVKLFGYRSGQLFGQAWLGYILLAKVISR